MIIDITPPVSEKCGLFPGESPLHRNVLCDMSEGATVTVSSITASVHVGAHADAPSHYKKGAPAIDEISLEPYIGECFVKHCPQRRCITREDALIGVKSGSKRLLFRTDTHDPHQFEPDFAYFDKEAIEVFAEAGVILIGIDTPSIDPRDSKDLPAHQAIARLGLRNLENLYLDKVAEGKYELIALPLKLVGFDASPVRAILRKL